MDTGEEVKGGDGAAYVSARQQVRVRASDGEEAYNHSIRNTSQGWVLS